MWGQARATIMEKDLADLKAQGALVAESLKAMNDSLKGLGSWMPKVDNSITTIQKSIEDMGARVAALEAVRSTIDDHTLRPDGHRHEHVHQGHGSDAPRVPDPSLVRGKRQFPHTPVHFHLGDQSTRDHELYDSAYTDTHSHGDRNHSRMPKTDFPRFDGENPKWWKTVCEK